MFLFDLIFFNFENRNRSSKDIGPKKLKAVCVTLGTLQFYCFFIFERQYLERKYNFSIFLRHICKKLSQIFEKKCEICYLEKKNEK